MALTSGNGVQPLADVTVVDITQVISGAFSTMMLGDLGAEIIKIEAPGRGDVCRTFEPNPQYFDALNRNKKSIELDLKATAGQDVAYRLLREADVFIENAKPGAIKEFNLDYESVCEVNPEIIYCSISGFGSESPYEHLPAWDMLIQGMSGMMGMTGEEGGDPIWSGMPVGDLAASMYAGKSIVTSLYARETGAISGEYIEVPMLDALVSWLTTRAGYSFAYRKPFPRRSYHPALAPFGVFDTNDGKIVIAAGTDGLWPSLCSGLDRPDLVDDSRFDVLEKRLENRHELREILQRELEQRPTDEWVEKLHAQSAPCGPVHDTLSVWDDEYVKTRGLHQVMERNEGEDADVIASPVRFKNQTTKFSTAPPGLGQHTEKVLLENEFSKEEVEQLRADGVI